VVALLDEDDQGAAGVAIGLWTLCFTWAHRNTRKRGKTPGLIPAGLPRRFLGQAGKDATQLLVKHGLWDAQDDGGWLFHDFEHYLPTEETREARSEAGKRGAAKRWAGHQKAAESDEETADDGNLPSACHEADGNEVASNGSCAPAPWAISKEIAPTPTPIPTPEPDPPSEDLFGAPAKTVAEKPKGRGKRTVKAPSEATRIPDDFTVDDGMADWAKREVPLVDWPFETGQFIDYWTNREKDDTKRSWPAAWRTWMRRAQTNLADRGITRHWSANDNRQGHARADPSPGNSVMPFNAPHAGTRSAHADRAPRSTGAERAEQAMSVAAELRAEAQNGAHT
jgi:hypothetical protein